MLGGNGALAPVLADPLASRARRWGDLRLRVLSAAILAPVALVCVWVGGAAFLAVVGLATLGLVVEWVQMWRGRGEWSPIQPARAGYITLLLGLAYIAVAAISLAWLRADPQVGRHNLLFLLILVWGSDVGAYLAGRAVGGAKLAPRISPGKTVSGAVGGLVAAVIVGAVFAISVPHPTSVPHAAVIAGVLGIIAQAGDLLESWIKRRFGVKDSGRLIPGHGGVLDRLDALLAAAPIAALVALAHGPGVVLWG